MPAPGADRRAALPGQVKMIIVLAVKTWRLIRSFPLAVQVSITPGVSWVLTAVVVAINLPDVVRISRTAALSLSARPAVEAMRRTLAADLEGQITALVGESGSGKTTTALALLGEKPAAASVTGRVEIAGSTADSGCPPPTGTVGYIPQHPSAALNPVRRIGPVLREIARLHTHADPRAERGKTARHRVLEALRQAQIPDGEQFLRRYPHQLSGGQQQRVVLAHELVGRPKVLIADEPTTGQDAVIRAQLIEELRTAASEGIAILLLTHDLELVRTLADHLLVMHRGVVVDSGRCSEVLGSPRHPYTRRLVDAQTVLAGSGQETTSEAREPVVSVRDLVAGHRRVDTLHDVSLDIRPGDNIAVVGQSGSGKTTLARCIAGLHPHREGEILLGTTKLSPLLRRRSRASWPAFSMSSRTSAPRSASSLRCSTKSLAPPNACAGSPAGKPVDKRSTSSPGSVSPRPARHGCLRPCRAANSSEPRSCAPPSPSRTC